MKSKIYNCLIALFLTFGVLGVTSAQACDTCANKVAYKSDCGGCPTYTSTYKHRYKSCKWVKGYHKNGTWHHKHKVCRYYYR